MRSHVWVIEMLVGDSWKPCADCSLSKRDAEGYNKLQQWQENNPADRFRIVRYERAAS